MMKMKCTFLILWALASALSAGLVVNEAGFDSRYDGLSSVESLILFPFDSRALMGAHFDHLAVSRNMDALLRKSFRERTGLRVAETKLSSADDGIRLTTVRDTALINRKVQDYNQRESERVGETVLASVKNANLYLTGTIDRFFAAGDFDESYIRLTLRLVDGASKTVYWVTTMEGCLRYVVNSIADSVAAGSYRAPSDDELRTARWTDPRTRQVRTMAWGLSMGSFTPLGSFRNEVRDSFFSSADLYFSAPFLKPVRNRFSIGTVKRIATRLEDGSSHILVPATLSFLYDLPYIRIPEWKVYPRADIGLTFSSLSFPGLEVQKNGRADLMLSGGVGVGTEYVFPSVVYYKPPFVYFHLPPSSVFLDLMIHLTGFRNSDFSASARVLFSVSAGFKIHL